jgi:hypothetical protein
MRVVALRLGRDKLLEGAEATLFKAMAVEIALIQRFVEENRLPTSTSRLPRKQLESVDSLAGL